MPVPLNRNLLLKEIVIECAPEDIRSPALNGLALKIQNTEGAQLDLEKISETTWKHSDVVEISPLTNQLTIVAWSTGVGDIGCISFTKDDWNEVDSPQLGHYLKRDFETGEVVVKLSLSLKVHISTSDQVSRWMSARGNPAVPVHASGLSNRDDDALKANQLNLLGDQFLEAFKISQDSEDVCKAIEAYKQAAACLSMDDPRLGPFLLDICFGYKERYDVFGSTEDLEEAITTGQMAIAVTAVEHPKFPALLSNLGGTFYHRFELTGDLDNISEAIQHRQRAVELTPDGHPDLPGRLSNLGFSFCDRFECTGDMDDISKAIQYGQQAVQLTPQGHDELPGTLCNLGDTFSSRFEHTGDLDDISNAIQSQQQAVQLAPDGHPALPSMLNNLGGSFSCRFNHTGDLDDISKAIQNQQRAIQLTPDGRAELPMWLANLGHSFRCRFDCTGELDDISKAIQNVQHAVQLTPDGHARLPGRLTILGMAFLSRFEHAGDLDDIFKAIQNQQRAVELTRDDHADLPDMRGNLGTAYLCRYERTGDLDNISKAIQNLQQAVELTPDPHSHFPSMLASLGTAFLRRFQRTGDLDSLSEAIQNQRRAVELTPDGHAGLPGMVNNLGTTLSERFKRSGDLADISEAIQHLQCAVQLTPDGRADLPSRLGNLGSLFWFRFEHTGDLDDIDKAIQNARRAVQLTPDGHADLPKWLTSLGNAFGSRFERIGDLDDISNAIQNYQRAVQLTPDGHAELPGWLSNLGISFCDRFKRTGNLDDIAEAIQNQQLALQLTPNEHTTFPRRLNNLGVAFHRRFKRTGNLDDAFEAIQYQRRAVQLTPDGHADLVIWLTNLGVSLCDRFECTGDLDAISEAIQNQQRAIKLTPEIHADLPGWFSNLGVSFSCRFKYTGDLDDISEAIRNYQRAIQLTPEGHADLPGMLVNLGNIFSSLFEATGCQEFRSNAVLNYRLAATSPFGRPSVRLHSATRWASISQEHPFLSSELLDAHACIIQLLSLVSGLENTVQRRYEALVDASQLSTAASAAALALGHPDKALEWLVEGRCIVWNQINQLRTPVDELNAHDQGLAQRLSAVSRELENAGSRWDSRRAKTSLSMGDKISLEEQAGKHIKLAKEWHQLLASIRNITGFEAFLRPRKCIDIMRQLPDEGVIVVINIHDDRCDALALRAGASDPVHVPLPRFSYKEAERLAKRLAKDLHDHQLRHRAISRKGIPFADTNDPPGVGLLEILKVLWSTVVWPILEALAFSIPDSESESLAKLPRIWWCPTGPLAFLPIHAAGIYVQAEGVPKECLSEFAVSSYIPMVNVLLKTSKSNSVKKRGDFLSRFMIVSQPNTPGRSRIPFAADEAKRISSQLEKRRISSVTLGDQNGTVAGLLKAMESFPCIHLACHANQNMKNPLKSSIYLHDGPLDLSEIMKKNLLYSDFAFLSACQTSMGDENLPEEVVHLAAGMLAAGYRSVVGTMWSIFDKYGPDLAEFFYETFLDGVTDEGSMIDGTGAAQALHHATQRLRMELSDSPESLLAWVPYIHIGI